MILGMKKINGKWLPKKYSLIYWLLDGKLARKQAYKTRCGKNITFKRANQKKLIARIAYRLGYYLG